MKKTRIVIAIVIALVVLALLLARCSSSSSSPSDTQAATPASQPTEELSLLGVQCETPGEVVEKLGASFVCTPTKKAGETKAIYYGVATPADELCDAPGKTRSVEGVFSVCADDSEPTKRKWLVTVPMPVAVTAFIEPGDSTEPAALEETGVTVPEAIAALPGMQEFAVASPTTEPATTVAPTSSQATTASTTPQTTTAGETTIPESTTTAAPTTTDETTTTGAPATTAAPTTTVAPAITAAPTTTEEPTTTVSPATTAAPTTTAAEVVLTCAQGGACNNGDTGPGGGTVLVLKGENDVIESVFEVAPVTWYTTVWKAPDYATKLVFGSKDDWRLPTILEAALMAQSRNLFTCPGSKRCARGFSKGDYWSTGNSPELRAVRFKTSEVIPGKIGGAYVRPVRSIGAPG